MSICFPQDSNGCFKSVQKLRRWGEEQERVFLVLMFVGVKMDALCDSLVNWGEEREGEREGLNVLLKRERAVIGLSWRHDDAVQHTGKCWVQLEVLVTCWWQARDDFVFVSTPGRLCVGRWDID